MYLLAVVWVERAPEKLCPYKSKHVTFKFAQSSFPLSKSLLSMGQLFHGALLSWEEGQKYADYIRKHGITQFLNIWAKHKDRHHDPFLWGDEVSLSAQTPCF